MDNNSEPETPTGDAADRWLRGRQGSGEKKSDSLFSINFEDGSTFALPKEWEDVFADRFGFNPEGNKRVDERVKFLVDKYVAHKAWPTQYDGSDIHYYENVSQEDLRTDKKYDYPSFYYWSWEMGPYLSGFTQTSGDQPTQAEIAQEVLYCQLLPYLQEKEMQLNREELSEAERGMIPEVRTPMWPPDSPEKYAIRKKHMGLLDSIAKALAFYSDNNLGQQLQTLSQGLAEKSNKPLRFSHDYIELPGGTTFGLSLEPFLRVKDEENTMIPGVNFLEFITGLTGTDLKKDRIDQLTIKFDPEGKENLSTISYIITYESVSELNEVTIFQKDGKRLTLPLSRVRIQDVERIKTALEVLKGKLEELYKLSHV